MRRIRGRCPGQLTIINGARKAEFALKPAGGNKLEVKGAKVVMLLVLANKNTRMPATFLIKLHPT